jgi:uncharacterized protein (DUF58 family)
MRWFASSSTGRSSDAGAETVDRNVDKSGDDTLLPAALLGALSGLELVSLARRRRPSEGAHPALRHGREEEFFQHRPYVRGDDLRAVDWRASARTGHPLLKERHQPSRRPLTLLLDTSASMAFPDGTSKLRQAKVLAAALAFLALRRGDSVHLSRLDGGVFRRVASLKPATRSLHAISRALGPLATTGTGDLAAALAASATAALRNSFVVVLSDLYGDEAALVAALASIRRVAEVAVVHVLAAGEKEIATGSGPLEELEGGAVTRLDAGAIRAHALRVAAWRERLRAGSLSAGAEWVEAAAAESPVTVLVRWLGTTA